MTLEELATYLNELIENSPVAILMLDPRHRVQLCNPAFERLFQYGRDELINANLEDLTTTHELTPEAVGIWKRVLLGEKVYASPNAEEKTDPSSMQRSTGSRLTLNESSRCRMKSGGALRGSCTTRQLRNVSP
jgi:PAS domain S-box-containing protein